MNRRRELALFQRRYIGDQQSDEKLINISSHQSDANQNHKDITSHL